MKWARYLDDAFRVMAAAQHVWKAVDEAGKNVSSRYADERKGRTRGTVTPIRRQSNGNPAMVSSAHIAFHNMVGRWPESNEELDSFMREYYGGFD